MALRPEHLNILSICTGGAGLDLGVELAIPSARTVCMVEREAFAVSTLVSAMEEGLIHPAPVWSDARTFDGRAWRGAVDGLIGGIPCQPHSLAGRKQGSNDERDLWSTARRIIVQSGAWFVVIENVGGMLAAGSDEIAGAQRVFRDLHKLGFETEGGLFTASEVGASHQRERIFIVAVADSVSERRRGRHAGWQDATHAHPSGEVVDHTISRRRGTRRNDHRKHERHEPSSTGQHFVEHTTSFGRGEGRPEPELWRGRPASSEPGGAMVDTIGGGCSRRSEVTEWRAEQRDVDERAGRRTLFAPGPTDIFSWCDTLASAPELEPAFRRVADGLASRMDIGRVDRLRMLGNGVVPLQAAYAIRTLATRLASRGSAGAARLCDMMEGLEA